MLEGAISTFQIVFIGSIACKRFMGSARGLSGLGFGAQPMGDETRKVAWARKTGERHLPKW